MGHVTQDCVKTTGCWSFTMRCTDLAVRAYNAQQNVLGWNMTCVCPEYNISPLTPLDKHAHQITNTKDKTYYSMFS
jgi:hypothetical protein